MNEGDDPLLPDVDFTATSPAGDGDDAGDIDGDEDAAAAAAAQPLAQEADPAPPPQIDTSAHEATIAALDEKINELQSQYDDGDLTSAEWNAQLKEVVKQQAVAQVALDNAAQQINAGFEAYRDSWFAKVTDYQAKHPYLADPDHFDDWDQALKMVNSNGAYQNLTMIQKVEQAHRIYAAHYEGVHGKPLATKPGLTTSQKAEAKDEAERFKLRTDQRPEAPTTLADLTNASDGGMEDGRFAQIDRVADKDPVQSEALFASMSEADQMAYLAGN